MLLLIGNDPVPDEPDHHSQRAGAEEPVEAIDERAASPRSTVQRDCPASRFRSPGSSTGCPQDPMSDCSPRCGCRVRIATSRAGSGPTTRPSCAGRRRG